MSWNPAQSCTLKKLCEMVAQNVSCHSWRQGVLDSHVRPSPLFLFSCSSQTDTQDFADTSIVFVPGRYSAGSFMLLSESEHCLWCRPTDRFRSCSKTLSVLGSTSRPNIRLLNCHKEVYHILHTLQGKEAMDFDGAVQGWPDSG